MVVDKVNHRNGSKQAQRPSRVRRSRARYSIPDITPIGSTESVRKTLPVAIHRIAKELHPEKIILFGSYAYGRPTPDSDVDLFVVMKTRSRHATRSWAVSKLLIPRPFPVDILVYTPREVELAIKHGNFFIQEIVTLGKVLYGQR